METTFNEFYASIYDDLYRDKSYSNEVAHIVSKIRQQGSLPEKHGRVLDFGCGTGNHAIEFCKLGFCVIGVDPSRFMVEKAKSKINSNTNIEFLVGGVESVKLRHFNLVTCLFNVLGYYSVDKDPAELMEIFHLGLLDEAGYIVIDFWDKSKIQNIDQSVTVKNYETRFGLAQRTTSSNFLMDDILEIDIDWAIDKLPMINSREKHQIKIFSPEYIYETLKLAGFRNIQSVEIPKGKYVDPRSSMFLGTACS